MSLPESERMIQNNMKAICEKRTVFIITHRLSTVRSVDRIIVMDQGCVIEQGAHHEPIQPARRAGAIH